jgi:acetoin utilization protein AcuC
LLPFSGDDSYEEVFREIISPVVDQFDPQVVIRNGGSDVHYLDKLTHLGVTFQGLYAIGKNVRAVSSCCDRLIDLTLSGYNQDVLPYAWLSLVCGVCNLEMPQIPPGFKGQKKTDKTGILLATQEVICKVKKILGRYWDFS